MPWSGRLRFDRPRWRENLRLPMDYPRLNEWPSGFQTSTASAWQVLNRADGTLAYLTGDTLADGLPLALDSGASVSLRMCPAR